MAKKAQRPVFVDKVAVTLTLMYNDDLRCYGWMAMGEDFAFSQYGFGTPEEARIAGNAQPLRWHKESTYLCCWAN